MRTVTTIGKKNIAYFEDILPPPGAYGMALGVIEEGEPVGTLAFSLEDDVVDIDNIFIASEHRRTGAGSELLTELSRMAESNHALGIQVTFPNDEHLTGFFEKNGFFTIPGDTVHAVRISRLLKEVKGTMEKLSYDNIIPLSKASSADRKEIQLLLDEEGYGRNALSSMECNEQLSFLLMDEKQKVSGFVLADIVDNNVFVDMLCMKKGKEAGSTGAIKLLGALLRTIEGNNLHTKADYFCFYAENESAYKLLKTFMKSERRILEMTMNYRGIKPIREEF